MNLENWVILYAQLYDYKFEWCIEIYVAYTNIV